MALAACKTSSRVEPPQKGLDREHIPAVYDRHIYGDVRHFKVGQWASYRLTQDGTPTLVTLAVVDRQKEDLWIEVITDRPRPCVSLRRVSPEGTIRGAYYREYPSEPVVQPVLQSPGGVISSVQPSEVTVSTRTVTVAETELEIEVEERVFEDESGARIVESDAWSQEVPPLYAASERGGLVRRRTHHLTVELLRFGSDAKPSFTLPKS